MPDDLSDVLQYLADLAPARQTSLDRAIRRDDFVLLDWRRLRTEGTQEPAASNAALPVRWTAADEGLERLAELDELHHAERLLRVGWLFWSGRYRVGDDLRRVFFPLVSASVTLERAGREGYRLNLETDLAPPSGLLPPETRDEIEEGFEELLALTFADRPFDAASLARSPTLAAWVRRYAAAIEVPVPSLLPPDDTPFNHRYAMELVVCTGMAVYLGRDIDAPGVGGALRGWASQDTSGTALAAIYGDGPSAGEPAGETASVASPLPLNARQAEAVARAGLEDVTVVSGPPGTGKSHLVAATAIDQVARGRSVLIATQSDYAADVVAGVLGGITGPRFVQFGRSAGRHSAADELTGGLAVPFSTGEVERREREYLDARKARDDLRATIANLLDRELAAADGLARRPYLATAAAQAPGVLDPDLDWNRVRQLRKGTRADVPLVGGWLRRRADRRLRKLLRARPEATVDDLILALDAGRAERAVRRGLAGNGVTLGNLWDRLEAAEGAFRTEAGRLVEVQRRSRENSKRDSARAVAALASVLRAGRVSRRRLLRDLRAGDFLDVLPLWLGTLTEIDDTLPVEPGVFDVVIFDEASQIDQMRAAPALARARRAVVVGDPRQLRHVSFVADDAMAVAARKRGIEPGLARLLDVRRNSLFDAAAGAAPVVWLEEHYRSVPHIIGFSADRFYDRQLRLMTQHPGVESRDAIRVVTVAGGERDEQGFNLAELDAVRREVRSAIDEGASSIGVVSPFRAQADRLEGMLVESFTGEERRRHGVRVGTVHGFQGSERDVIIASMALGPEDVGQSLRFVEDPNLFNVLVTRARREMVVVTSLSAEGLPAGLFADYLRYSDEPPLPSETATPPSGWVRDLADALGSYGLAHTADYPVAGWTVDLAIGEGEAAIGVECVVHPGGADTHIERHLALRRAGWRLTDAYQTRWLTQPDEAVADLARQVLQ